MKMYLILSLVVLSGCSPHPDGRPHGVKERCIKGVTYYITGYAISPAYKKDGTLYLCNK